MQQLATGWDVTVDTSPDWIFFALRSHGDNADHSPPMADSLWGIAEQHGLNRIVLQIDDETLLTSYLVGQMILLHKRAHLGGGAFRVCCVSPQNYRVIESMRLADRFPNYRDRGAAVMGHLGD